MTKYIRESDIYVHLTLFKYILFSSLLYIIEQTFWERSKKDIIIHYIQLKIF